MKKVIALLGISNVGGSTVIPNVGGLVYERADNGQWRVTARKWGHYNTDLAMGEEEAKKVETAEEEKAIVLSALLLLKIWKTSPMIPKLLPSSNPKLKR
ncbi:hypothetical protein HAX54_022737 [Datura stramonium]|uniref:Uncharacterized protein n=1 Tax=Datura stramonium TaxID=4076 RepID=A0ABS8UWX8_DATST|nr:hypothetical protein [Datura stramonium]